MEFDYEIQYRKGHENLVADELSRIHDSEVLYSALSVVHTNLVGQIS